MRDILGLIPFAGAGHGVIPQMVGQAQRAITMRLGHGQHIGRGLPLVMAAGGQNRVAVEIVIAQKFSHRLWSFHG